MDPASSPLAHGHGGVALAVAQSWESSWDECTARAVGNNPTRKFKNRRGRLGPFRSRHSGRSSTLQTITQRLLCAAKRTHFHTVQRALQFTHTKLSRNTPDEAQEAPPWPLPRLKARGPSGDALGSAPARLYTRVLALHAFAGAKAAAMRRAHPPLTTRPPN